MRGTKMTDIRGWGVVGGNAALDIEDSDFRDPYHGAIYWNSTTNGVIGPRIHANRIFKTDPAKYGTHGGIHIRTAGTLWTDWNLNTIVTQNYIELPVGNIADSVGIDVWQGQAPLVWGNYVKNGRIGYSLYATQFFRLSQNQAFACHDYAYEYVACSYGTHALNNGRGWGGGLNYGVSAVQETKFCKFYDSNFIGFSGYGGQDHYFSGDSTPNTVR